ncbi:MAG: hypothetical protein K0S23_1354 [Fluviicola sp.]|jgi:hypothetical protein|uniref:hypothetical protein n=1 Tax=Fluviicola sp. TaxID=1917219 RepID=UPI002613C42C|nr:hypothetical protein [Fluviicola sp.]MDF3027047.1 hypothetical protein [Fluviicola sp.]
MLDFYFIPNDQTKPPYPTDLEFAGELDGNVFGRLQSKGIIDKRFDYYSDFRWSEVLLKQIRKTIDDKQLHSDTDVKKLLQFVDTALEKQSGLIAYGD